jgi:hypothetical protein
MGMHMGVCTPKDNAALQHWSYALGGTKVGVVEGGSADQLYDDVDYRFAFARAALSRGALSPVASAGCGLAAGEPRRGASRRPERDARGQGYFQACRPFRSTKLLATASLTAALGAWFQAPTTILATVRLWEVIARPPGSVTPPRLTEAAA